jgi:transposase
MKCPLSRGGILQVTEEVTMWFSRSAVERAMKVQQVILKAMAGEYSWIQAAEILGMHPRSVRRWRERMEAYGYTGLLDRRRAKPSPRRVPLAELERVLRLYRETYPGFNGRHFHQTVRREHGVTLSYSFVKKALQEAGLLKKGRIRGRHRRRREPRACLGEMLHLDGSLHAWLALLPEEKQTLVAVQDDATKRLLFAALFESESSKAVMLALRHVLETQGLPMALYTDRAGWAVHTPKAGGPYDKDHLTHVGRALHRLGIEHILSYSPQARGRSERLNRTLQDRLVNELRVTGIREVPAANRYLRERFIPRYNEEFARPPQDPTSAFVPLGRVDVEQILCHEFERTVGQDNTVSLDLLRLQIDKQRGRRTCAGLRVLVRRHLNGQHSVWWGTRCLGRYDFRGRPLKSQPAVAGDRVQQELGCPWQTPGLRSPRTAFTAR